MDMNSFTKIAISGLVAVFLGNNAVAETIYACVHQTNGNVRIVSAPGQCHKTENDLSWLSGSGVDQAINSLQGRLDAVEYALGVVNDAPEVDVGPDKTVLTTETINIAASVADDGLVQPLTLLWSATGPGVVYFSSTTTANTEVIFAEPGSYTITLAADDGLTTVQDSAEILVYPYNFPPEVDAGPDQLNVGAWDGEARTITCVFSLIPDVLDDGLPLPLTFEWQTFGVTSWYSNAPSSSISRYITDPTSANTTITTIKIIPESIDPSISEKAYGYLTTRVSVNDGYFTETDNLDLICVSPFFPDFDPLNL